MLIGKVRSEFIYPFLVMLFSITVFLPALTGEFVFDDQLIILQNNNISGTNDILTLLSQPFGGVHNNSHSAYYRPLVTLSFKFNYWLSEFKPVSYHVVNLLLHALVSLAIYLFTLLLFDSKKFSFFISLLFSIHPVHTPTASWIAGRVDSFSALFLICAIIFYLRAERGQKFVNYLFSLLSFLLAMASKEIAFVYPGALLLVELYRSDFSIKKTIRVIDKAYYLLVIILLVSFLSVRLSVLGSAGDEFSLLSMFVDSKQILIKLLGYLYIVFAPFYIHAFYFEKDLFDLVFYFGAAVVFLTLLIAIVILRNNKKVIFGAAWLLLFILPLIGIHKHSSLYLLAPHAAYLAVFGGAVVVTSVVMDLFTKYAERIGKYEVYFYTAGAVLLLALAVESFQKSKNWRTNVELYSYMALNSPSDYTYNLLGNAWLEKKNYSEAEQNFQASLKYNQENWNSWFGLSLVEVNRNNLNQAKDYLQTALRYNDRETKVYNNLGNIYYIENDYENAVEMYARALKFDSGNSDALQNIIRVLKLSGKHKEALEYYGKYTGK